MKAICPICGNEFEKLVHNKKLCSTICVKEYQKEYKKSDKYKEYQKKYNKEYQKTYKRKEYNKKYNKTDKRKEYKKDYHRVWDQKNTINMNDRYIKTRLGMPDAPKELIELKREQLKLHRLIKQMS